MREDRRFQAVERVHFQPVIQKRVRPPGGHGGNFDARQPAQFLIVEPRVAADGGVYRVKPRQLTQPDGGLQIRQARRKRGLRLRVRHGFLPRIALERLRFQGFGRPHQWKRQKRKNRRQRHNKVDRRAEDFFPQPFAPVRVRQLDLRQQAAIDRLVFQRNHAAAEAGHIFCHRKGEQAEIAERADFLPLIFRAAGMRAIFQHN